MNSPLKVLLDSNGLQAAVHQGIHPNPKSKNAANRRLITFLAIIDSLGCEPSFIEEKANEITDDLLINCSCLVITTRMPRLPRQTKSELNTIYRFVQRGGSLLVMSNHPFNRNRFKESIPDKSIALRFGVTLHESWYPDVGERKGFVEIWKDDLYPHPITNGLCGPIVFNNGCRISTRIGNVIAKLPSVSEDPDIFAVAIEKPEDSKARIVVTADSGFIGDEDTNFPAPGLINSGDNIGFIRQVFEWLLKFR